MGFFNEIGKRVSDAGQKTLQKTKEISDTARINSLITDEERRIDNAYYQIGKLYVSLHGQDCEEELAGMVGTIAESNQKIKDYQQQIQDIKGVCRCEKCGAEVARGAAFCSSCGAAMPQIIMAGNPEEYTKCENCGATVKKEMRFCTSCGKPMIPLTASAPEKLPEQPEAEEKICPNCGQKQADPEAVFCTECGTKL